jgi:hypothetical protein
MQNAFGIGGGGKSKTRKITLSPCLFAKINLSRINMSRLSGINDFHSGKFNPSIQPRSEYMEGYLFALAEALGEYNIDNYCNFDDGMEWIHHFIDNSVGEILTKGYESGWVINQCLTLNYDDDF